MGQITATRNLVATKVVRLAGQRNQSMFKIVLKNVRTVGLCSSATVISTTQHSIRGLYTSSSCHENTLRINGPLYREFRSDSRRPNGHALVHLTFLYTFKDWSKTIILKLLLPLLLRWNTMMMMMMMMMMIIALMSLWLCCCRSYHWWSRCVMRKLIAEYITVQYHIEAQTKWPPVSRRHFQTHLLEWKCSTFD